MLSWRAGVGGKREGLARLRDVNADKASFAQGAHAGRASFVPSPHRRQPVPMHTLSLGMRRTTFGSNRGRLKTSLSCHSA